MVKIRDCILNEDKILSFDTLAEGEGSGVQVVMEGGHTLDLFDVDLNDVVAILTRAGLMTEAYLDPPEPAGPRWSQAELLEQYLLVKQGFRYMAAQTDGRVYAYEVPPEGGSGGWYPRADERLGPALVVGPMPHLMWEDGIIDLSAPFAPSQSGEA